MTVDESFLGKSSSVAPSFMAPNTYLPGPSRVPLINYGAPHSDPFCKTGQSWPADPLAFNFGYRTSSQATEY
jgi:hypothetical protein